MPCPVSVIKVGETKPNFISVLPKYTHSYCNLFIAQALFASQEFELQAERKQEEVRNKENKQKQQKLYPFACVTETNIKMESINVVINWTLFFLIKIFFPEKRNPAARSPTIITVNLECSFYYDCIMDWFCANAKKNFPFYWTCINRNPRKSNSSSSLDWGLSQLTLIYHCVNDDENSTFF